MIEQEQKVRYVKPDERHPHERHRYEWLPAWYRTVAGGTWILGSVIWSDWDVGQPGAWYGDTTGHRVHTVLIIEGLEPPS